MTAAARLLALPVLLLPLAAAAQTPPNAAPEATLQAWGMGSIHSDRQNHQ